jgi:nitroreductase
MNETLRVIAERYSCRAYDGRLPGKEILEAIALAGLQAPSGLNRQPWQIIVITDKVLIEEMDAEGMRIIAGWEDKSAYQRFMARGGSLFYNAPCMLLMLKQPGTDLDCGIITENIALAAHSLGVANVICGMANVPLSGEKGTGYKERIGGFVDGWEFGMAVLMGYAKEPGQPHTPDKSKVRFL